MEPIKLDEFVEEYWNNSKYENHTFIFSNGANSSSIIADPFFVKHMGNNLHFEYFRGVAYGEVKHEMTYSGIQFSFKSVAIYHDGVESARIEIKGEEYGNF